MRPSADVLRRLFENAPRFVDRLANEEATSEEELIDRAENMAGHLPEDQKLELINGHPRIGADPTTVSAISFREQGYDRSSASPDPQLAARLQRLNDDYERRFGFRFVVFVNGRPRSEIADEMDVRLSADRSAELERALSDVFAIARDRLNRMEVG